MRSSRSGRGIAGGPGSFRSFKSLPRQLLDELRALQALLARSQGRDYEGSGLLVSRVLRAYFSMLSASSSELRFLP